MAIVGSSVLPSPSTQDDTQVTIFNLTIAAANTEQSQALPLETKEFLIKSRGPELLRVSFNSGESGSKFVTIRPGAVFTVTQFFSSQTIYFQSPTVGAVVELIAFT